MNKRILATATSLATFMLAMSANAATPNSGTINITGKVTEASCVVDPASVNVNVALPTVDTSTLSQQHDVAGRTGFVLKVSGCPLVKVSAAFTPDSNVGANGNLNNVAADGTNAQVQLLDKDMTAINIQTDSVASQQARAVETDAGGNAQLQYYAQYYAEQPATQVGDMQANVKFTLTYE